MKRFWKWLTRNWWVVRRGRWPYRTGYCTYNLRKRMVLDTGLTKTEARQICRELNA